MFLIWIPVASRRFGIKYSGSFLSRLRFLLSLHMKSRTQVFLALLYRSRHWEIRMELFYISDVGGEKFTINTLPGLDCLVPSS